MLLLKNSSSTLTGRNVRLSNLLISSCQILALTGWERNCPEELSGECPTDPRIGMARVDSSNKWLSGRRSIVRAL